MTNDKETVDFAETVAALSPSVAQVRSGRRVASGVLFEDGAHVITIARLMGRKDRGVIVLGDEEMPPTRAEPTESMVQVLRAPDVYRD